MPSNPNYNHELFVEQLHAHVKLGERAAYIGTEMHQKLAAPLPDAYDIDHAAERLHLAASRLREAADRMESLAAYARY